MSQNHRMPRVRIGHRSTSLRSSKHRAEVAAKPASAPDAEFGWDPPAGEVPPVEILPPEAVEPVSEPAPELIALGLPPEDAAGIQKWNYRVLSTMAALALRSTGISEETRMKRVAALTLAAARHYPEAAKYDLNEAIRRDAEATAGRKRAKAAAKLERRSVASGAKVIPIRRDA